MPRAIVCIVPVGLLALVLVLAAKPSAARPLFSTRTKQKCVFCHPADKWDQLTDAGEYYKQHRTLDGYGPKPKAY
jgi:hypothetical protein